MLLSTRSLAQSPQGNRTTLRRIDGVTAHHVPRRFSNPMTLSWNRDDFEENALPGAPLGVFGPGISPAEAQDTFPSRARPEVRPEAQQAKPASKVPARDQHAIQETLLSQVFPVGDPSDRALSPITEHTHDGFGFMSVCSRSASGLDFGHTRSEMEANAAAKVKRKEEKSNEDQGGLFSFTDKECIRRKVRGDLLKRTSQRKIDRYQHTGFWQWIARHPVFDHATLAIIALNALWLWIDTDLNDADTFLEADPFFQLVEHFFCAYFTWEIVVRFLALKRKVDMLRDAWFVFDAFLVVLAVTETWFLLVVTVVTGGPFKLGSDASLLRLIRLLRLSRLLRFMRSMSELMILVKGMLTAMRSVLYVICLLAILTYAFAIALTQLSNGTEFHQRYFGHVALAMYSLLVHGTLLDDLSGFCNQIRSESTLCLVLVFIFIALACCTVMNMLIGVLCEVVSSTATTEREEILTNLVSEKMQKILHSLDGDNNNMISYEEFTQIMEKPEALQALEDIGVDLMHIIDFAELFFFEDGIPVQQTFANFMGMVLDLRGSNPATVKDVKQLWLDAKNEFNVHKDALEVLQVQMKSMEVRQKDMEDKMDTVLREVQALSRCLLPPSQQPQGCVLQPPPRPLTGASSSPAASGKPIRGTFSL